ncbi:acyltransferase [Chitinimonas arctica]|uniref:Acyltransferase n=1 Tax=Chitinimonas arctica TaxID=2594795 RepID=A0A516SB75_9NEIS|nr:acyltransferase [Chitinimonas arctica]QDQ25402.1 acyltransferase [Chitinimonas arctica]
MSETFLARNPRIDLLRGIAIALVLLLHFHLAYGLHISVFAEWFSPKAVKMVAINGNFGVTLFFVISGFLITGSVLQRHGSLANIDLKAFYAYRASRILPCLLLALAVIVGLGSLELPFFGNSDDGQVRSASYFWISAGSVLTFWHNVLMQEVGWFNYCLNIYWSLSVEEMFYLGFPLLCLLFRRDWLIILACLAFIVIGPYYRSLHSDDELFFECGYLACFDAIAIGCLAAMLARRIKLASRMGQLAQVLAAVLLAAVYLRGIHGNEVFGFSLVALAGAVLLIGATGKQAGPLLRSAPLAAVRWMGRHSYELYLFHIIVLALMRNLIPTEAMPYAYKPLWLALFLVLSALLAGVVAKWYAEPLNRRVRKRLVQVKTNVQVVPREVTV